ncbi:MAG TPA: STAS domain-containing protein [Accumulibacter sp.]|jgi:Anti-anti-sigma regulatory factor (antagonist of anti-sigma factor)|nr:MULTISPECIES: STAS domain-containing protein [unclassified Candidatus Accumulibacter]HRE70729.1 STAS domain-containing protein [Accumulibacter sp.]HRE84864.1 STAS domain-containing protein [Accumulibacter sp.]HRI90734.1 STAS domain-containing protein [Accumulibacter sp.]
MVFSFFKKQPEKIMRARPAAVPQPTNDRGSATGVSSKEKPKPVAAPVGLARSDVPFATPAPTGENPPLDLSEFVFSEIAAEFQVEAELDPLDAEAEEAAMFFANGQDAAARALLEKSTSARRSGPGERLWLMLFDLLRLTGQKSAFEALEIEYAQAFEKQPPVWRDAAVGAREAGKVVGTALFKGDLLGDNDAGFEAVRLALKTNSQLRLDLSKVRQLDAAGCERLLALLQQARRGRGAIDLLGRDGLGALLDSRIAAGRPEDRACWLLKLELCQLRGQLEVFEEMAINYAVTFEISPPSWEFERVADNEPAPLELAAADQLLTEAYVIKGEIRGARFSDLQAYAAAKDPVLVDCSTVTRMDFLSAGALLNALTTVKRSGRQIIVRHPNHLLAELFRVVGLRSVAEIDLARN